MFYVFFGKTCAHRTSQSSADEARRRLRSASTSSLVVRRTRLSTLGDRAFPVAADRLWNTVTERHVGCVTDCFSETFEDPSLHPNPLWCTHSDVVILDAIIDFLLTYLLTQWVRYRHRTVLLVSVNMFSCRFGRPVTLQLSCDVSFAQLAAALLSHLSDTLRPDARPATVSVLVITFTIPINQSNQINQRTSAQRLLQKTFSSYIAPQAAYATSSELCVTDRAGVQSRPQSKSANTDFGLNQYSQGSRLWSIKCKKIRRKSSSSSSS